MFGKYFYVEKSTASFFKRQFSKLLVFSLKILYKKITTKTTGYAAHSATSPLKLFQFDRRELRPQDVMIDILFCGICHSDLHMARNEWGSSQYPIVPGHEILGKVSQIGSGVSRHKIGDLVAVGCISDCCRSCPSCKEGLEQYCDNGFTLVFNAPDLVSGDVNYGGFSKQIVVEDRFVLQVPSKFQVKDLAAVAPLLCAGVTTYSPLKHWNVGKGTIVGIVGLGGLGHVAVKQAHAMGAHVVVFTTSQDKATEAHLLGADEVVVSTNKDEMAKQLARLDFILSTVAAVYDLNPFLELLHKDGTMCLVGLPPKPHPALKADTLIMKRRQLAGSLIGGIKETQECLNFCAEHNILASIELISIDQVNEAFDRMLKNDVKYRFVIDMATLHTARDLPSAP